MSEAKRSIRIGLCQYPAESRSVALDWIWNQLEQAAGQSVQLAVLPELFAMPYVAQEPRAEDFKTTDHVLGPEHPEFVKLQEFAAEHAMVLVVPTLVQSEVSSDKFLNRSYVIDSDGSIAGFYTKVHIPEDPGYYEQQYFEPGAEVGPVVHTTLGKIAPMICFDQWFPEAARQAVLKGAEILIYSTALGTVTEYEHTNENWPEAWRTVQRGHAIANGVHVVAVNRCGTENQIHFFGSSFVSDAFGNILVQLGDEPTFEICDVDLAMNRQIQEGWGFLEHRRPDLYTRLGEPK